LESLDDVFAGGGGPLDNNICERAIKRAVLHRKNALFYRTLHGAEVGDLFMTLIHTCQLCGANSFDYLTELLRHASELAATPAEWMPIIAKRWSGPEYDESWLAEKDHLRPGGIALSKYPKSPASQKAKSGDIFGHSRSRSKTVALISPGPAAER
jgi:hypothetical protein